jgi:precorrin-8X/cobalt-precorrin-8 methylmutase
VAAIREMSDSIDGSIVAIGNAPTALLALLDLIDERKVNPALIIGMPVGFVACAESKDELAKRDLPYITILGNRGGSSAAAATVNGLLDLL